AVDTAGARRNGFDAASQRATGRRAVRPGGLVGASANVRWYRGRGFVQVPLSIMDGRAPVLPLA
ncbi:hypothetical protein ACFPYM_04255, partial [Methylobacterium hispanicum]